MNPALFSLIAHKPDSSDYCRGCLMEQWSGAFHTHHGLTPDEVVDAALPHVTLETEDREAGYNLYLTGVIDGEYVYVDDLMDSSPDHEVVTGIRNEIRSRVVTVLKAREEVKAKEHAKKVRQTREANTLRELAELERLSVKYRDQP